MQLLDYYGNHSWLVKPFRLDNYFIYLTLFKYECAENECSKSNLLNQHGGNIKVRRIIHQFFQMKYVRTKINNVLLGLKEVNAAKIQPICCLIVPNHVESVYQVKISNILRGAFRYFSCKMFWNFESEHIWALLKNEYYSSLTFTVGCLTIKLTSKHF